MANRVKCLRVIDMYNCNVFVGLKHGGNLLQKVDNSSCSRTRWPEGELVFDLLSNRRPMECRIDEGVNYESLNDSRQDGDDGDGTVVSWSRRARNFRRRMDNGRLPLA